VTKHKHMNNATEIALTVDDQVTFEQPKRFYIKPAQNLFGFKPYLML